MAQIMGGAMVRFSFLFLLFAFNATALPGDDKAEYQCPLNNTFDLGIQAAIELSESEQYDCEVASPSKKKWQEITKGMKGLAVKLHAFHGKTISPLPESPKEETAKLARALSEEIVALIMDTENVLIKGGKLCNGKTLRETNEEALVQVVRSLYAANEELRDVAGIADISSRIPGAYKEMANLVKAQKEWQEKRFTDGACEFLEKEAAKCKSGVAPKTLSDTDQTRVNQVRDDSQSYFNNYNNLLKQNIEGTKKTLPASIKNFFRFQWLKRKKKTTAPEQSAESRKDKTEAYFAFIVPKLKMCALQATMAPYTNIGSKYAEECEMFLCDQEQDGGLLKSDPKSKGGRAAACLFLENFATMAKDYLDGFLEGKKNGSLCPTLRTLPPVEASPAAGETH